MVNRGRWWTVVPAQRTARDRTPTRIVPTTSDTSAKLPRPDGNGSVLAIAGIHTEGSLGVVRLLASDLSTLWGQVGEHRFSTLVGVEYDPETGEPQSVELLTPSTGTTRRRRRERRSRLTAC